MDIGEKVWFISKYGDRVEGIYRGPTKAGHIVDSFNAFGRVTTECTTCIIHDLTNLHRVDAK